MSSCIHSMGSTGGPAALARRGLLATHGEARALVAAGIAIAAVAAAFAALPWLGMSNYWLTLIYYVCYVAALGQAWNLMAGLTGYVSFAHGAFAGLGAYMLVLSSNHGVPLPLAILLAPLAAAVGSLAIGATSLRLRGVAFTFATLFFQAILALVVKKFEVTGGAGGLVLDRIVALAPAYAAAVLLAAATTYIFIVVRTLGGTRLLAIKDDETAAAASGIATARAKLLLFCLSAALAGLVGCVHAIFLSSLYPDVVFSFEVSLTALVVPLIGGIATAAGPLLGGIVFVLLRELLQVIAPGAHATVMGALILTIILFMPQGLVGMIRSLARGRRP